MDQEIKSIELHDTIMDCVGSIYVTQISDNIFRMEENDIFNCRLVYGTEFETKINEEGKHEITSILKKAPYVTRRFLLSTKFTESEYRILGDEIIRIGGFWQTDFGGIATINIPKGSNFDLDQIFKIFNFYPTEIKD